jgi:Holliday junction DNA helicase RuvB
MMDKSGGEKAFDNALRPNSLNEYIGQTKLKANLSDMIQSSLIRKAAVDHVLLSGPPGLGKTSIAAVIAYEMKTKLHLLTAPALSGDKGLSVLAGTFSQVEEGDVVFIDEIHRLSKKLEESLYMTMEDNQFPFVSGKGKAASLKHFPVAKHTLVGATTLAHGLTPALRDRFGFHAKLDFYEIAELQQIIQRSAKILDVHLDKAASLEVAKRSRGTPRIANQLTKRLRDYSLSRSKNLTAPIVKQALAEMGVDDIGLNDLDRKVMEIILSKFDGGPVGVNTLAAAVGEAEQTIVDIVEPYLIRNGFLDRSPRGRVLTPRGAKHLTMAAH